MLGIFTIVAFLTAIWLQAAVLEGKEHFSLQRIITSVAYGLLMWMVLQWGDLPVVANWTAVGQCAGFLVACAIYWDQVRFRQEEVNGPSVTRPGHLLPSGVRWGDLEQPFADCECSCDQATKPGQHRDIRV